MLHKPMPSLCCMAIMKLMVKNYAKLLICSYDIKLTVNFNQLTKL